MRITQDELDAVTRARNSFARAFFGRHIERPKDACPPEENSVHWKDVRIALLEYAVLRIADEASREDVTWKSLKKCIIAQAQASLEPGDWEELECAIRQRICRS